MKKWIFVLLIGLIGLAVFPALAQDEDTVLEYGDTIVGALSENYQDKTTYTFEGKAKDIVLISVQLIASRFSETGGLINTFGMALELTDSQGNSINTESDQHGSLMAAGIIVVELPADDVYTLKIGRRENTDPNRVIDQFELSLSTPIVAHSGDSTSATNNGAPQFYLVRPEANSLSITIDFTDAVSDFALAVSVASNTQDAATIDGEMINGTLSVATTSGELYLVAVYQTVLSVSTQIDYTVSFR